MDEAHLTVIQHFEEIDPAQPASIHHLRVAFKKFRYMIEVIQPCLPGFPESKLKRMQDCQTRMGNIHDTQVLLETIVRFAKKTDSYNPQPVQRFYEQVLAKALSTYLKNKDDVRTFWRATPLSPFPWEADQIKKE